MQLKSIYLNATALLAVLAVTPAVAVDWPQPGLNAAHTGFNKKEKTISAANIGRLHQKWAVPIPNGIQGPAPLELNGVAYAQSTDGTDYAVDVKTGKTLWTYVTGGGGGTAAGIAAGGKSVYTTCNVDGNGHFGICSLNAATGAVNWKFTIADCGGGQAPSSSAAEEVPVVDNGMVFFSEGFGGFNSPCSGDYVYALNAGTGKPVWSVSEATNAKGGGVPFAIDKGKVFYPTGGANIYICAVNEANGSAIACSAGLSAAFADYATLSVSGGKVLSLYLTDNSNTIVSAFDETTLGVVWTTSVSGGTSTYSRYAPTVADGRAFFYAGTNGNGSLYAVSLKTGKQLWSYACNSTACLNSGVSAANGVLYASCDKETTLQGDQCAFDAKTGVLLRLFGSTDGNAGTESTPLVANGAEIGACGAYGGNLCEFVP